MSLPSWGKAATRKSSSAESRAERARGGAGHCGKYTRIRIFSLYQDYFIFNYYTMGKNDKIIELIDDIQLAHGIQASLAYPGLPDIDYIDEIDGNGGMNKKFKKNEAFPDKKENETYSEYFSRKAN